MAAIHSVEAAAPGSPDAPAPPAVEAPRRDGWVRAVAALALAWGATYLAWRLLATGTGTNRLVFALLLGAEAFAWVTLALYAFLAWRVPTSERPAPGRPRTVDVFVCTYDEPVDVVQATLLGCRSLTRPHTTWLLDDGRRPEMASLAERLGARYLTRPDNAHAKAGNINHALAHTDGELVVVLDADHVPLPDLLDATVGYFDDDQVALVQTPHHFSNLDSIQHTPRKAHEQEIFFRVICPGKDRHNGVYWCGSGAVLRREALEQAGGVRYETVAEDFHTTIVMHQHGWRTRYHDEVLVQGRAPHDLGAFLLQRDRWARGNLRVLRTAQNPIWARGLTPLQRISYLSALTNYLGGPQRLLLLVLLVTTLLTGTLPMNADPVALAALWGPWALLSAGASVALSRRRVTRTESTAFTLMTAGVFTVAALSVLLPRAGTFRVTPKAGVDRGGAIVLRQMWLLTLLAGGLVVGLVARLGEVVGLVPLPPLPAFALAATTALGLYELGTVGALLHRLVRRRQLRLDYRQPVELAGRVEGTVVRVTDLTPRGLSVVGPEALVPGGEVTVTLTLPTLDGGTRELAIPVAVRSSCEVGGGRWRAGLEVLAVEEDVRDALVHHCHVVAPVLDAGTTGSPALPEVSRQHPALAGAESA